MISTTEALAGAGIAFTGVAMAMGAGLWAGHQHRAAPGSACRPNAAGAGRLPAVPHHLVRPHDHPARPHHGRPDLPGVRHHQDGDLPVTQLALDTQSSPTATTAAGPRPLIIGLDVAMGISGVAGAGWTDYVRCAHDGQHERFAYQLDGLASFYRSADYVVIEGPAYSKNNNGADALAAMRWMVRHDLWKRQIPYAVITPSKRLTYATGSTVHYDEQGARIKGIPLKALVREAVSERYGVHTEGPAKHDEADAYVLVAMAYDHLGHPLAEVPATHRRALAGCDWSPFAKAVAA